MSISFEKELANAFKEFDNSICIIMEIEWGFNASHPDQPPYDNVKPG